MAKQERKKVKIIMVGRRRCPIISKQNLIIGIRIGEDYEKNRSYKGKSITNLLTKENKRRELIICKIFIKKLEQFGK